MQAGRLKPISLADPVLGEAEKEALCSVIDAGWLTMGERVAAFEREFARLQGVTEAVALNSCTAGLHVCLAALDIGPGDEVLVPSLTFVATASAVLYVGATPIFVDIEASDRPHMSLSDAQAKCTGKTKAAIIMHYGGYIMDVLAWRRFCDEHGFWLIEDAAHTAVAERVGRCSDAATFSFFSNKNMTTAEGGMVVARDKPLIDRIRQLRAHGMTSNTLDRYRGHAYSYDVITLGYNYRMDELRAALGLVQLSQVSLWTAQRRSLTDYYRQCLAEQLPELVIPFEAGQATSAHLMPVLLPQGIDRSAVMERLRESGIQSSIHYPPIHLFSYYRARFPELSLPCTEEFSTRELTLPLHPKLTKDDVERVVKTLEETLSKVCNRECNA